MGYSVTEGAGTDFISDTIAGDHVPAYREQPFSTGGQGAKDVTTAATPVALAASTACRVVWIKAKSDNTGVVAWGWSNTVRASGTVIGDQLEPGEKVAVAVTNLSLLWIDAAVSGDGVTYTYAGHVDS